jgi:hypothetical protein
MASVEFSLGKGAASVFSSASATTGIIVALAVLGQASHNLIARLCPLVQMFPSAELNIRIRSVQQQRVRRTSSPVG